MNQEPSNTDYFLLEYLEKKYQLQRKSSMYMAAKILLQRLWQGSICIPVKEITDFDTCEYKKSGILGAAGDVCPFILDGENLYIQRYFYYQKRIIEIIEKLQKTGRLHIITGSPGTGKTTSLARTLAEEYVKRNREPKIMLAAPTGKAAFRMNEALKKSLVYDDSKKHTHWLKDISQSIIEKLNTLESKTIHRLLGYRHLSINFIHTKENPLDADIVVIDECSMVDLPMMSKLLDAIPDNDCMLYLLGDKNQLASVEAGSVFADICGKFANDESIYTELTENHRAKFAPGIIDLSLQILRKSIENPENDNVHFKGALSLENMADEYRGFFNSVDEKEALEMLDTFQILCAVKKGKNGTENINKELLIKARAGNAKFTPIIVSENNYQINLFNGDIGVMDTEKAYFLNGSEIRQFPLLTLPKYDSAFAITIHKSQGSEYSRIAVVYPEKGQEIDNTGTIFTRELLYTAITRARLECNIYGSLELIKNSCKKEIYRASGIK